MPATTPQDRKPKADADFTFEVDGKTHHLPRITETVADSIPGGVTYAAVMEPENPMAQMRLVLATLEATKPNEKAMAALKSLNTNEMLRTAQRWMGESRGSSD